MTLLPDDRSGRHAGRPGYTIEQFATFRDTGKSGEGLIT
jgi:hypothetical protein